MKFQAVAEQTPNRAGYPAYRKKFPGGMSLDGLAEVFTRVVYGGVPIVGGAAMAKPDLGDKEIGYPPLLWDAEIAAFCKRAVPKETV
jgi:hypothetical protein